jgi:hypothetical protein
MKRKHVLSTAVAAALTIGGTSLAQAAVIVLDFEGLGDLEPINSFYDGGLGGNGSGPGPDYDLVFSSNALAVIDADAGGSGNFGGEPSPDTIMFFLTGSAVLDVPAGFDTGFSFYYSAINNTGIVNVYDGLGATGTLLASLNLPLTPNTGAPDPNGNFSPFVPFGVAFAGIAKSVDFGGTVNQIGFDDITFGSATPGNGGNIPLPGTLALLGLGAAGLGATRRRVRRS